MVMGVRDEDNEEKYRISRKEAEERFSLTSINYYCFM